MSSCGGNSVVTDNLVGSDIDPYGGRTHLSEPVLPFTFSRYSHIGVVMKDTFSAIGHLVNPNVVEEQSEPEEIDGEESKRADPSTISSEVHQGRTNLRRITSKVGTSTVELYQASSRSSASPCLQCPVCRKVIFLRGHLPSGSTAKCDCRVCGLLADGTQLAFVNPNGKGKLMINAGIGAFCRQCRRQSPSPKDTQGATESSTTPNNLVASNNCGQTQAEVQSAPEPVGLNPSPSGVKLERLDEVESVQDGSNELCNLISYQSPEKTVTCPASRCSSVSGLICRICHDPDKPNAPLIAPCRCRGTIEFVHVECLIHWLHYYCQKMRKPPQCELCNYRFRRRKVLRVRNFNLPKCSYRDKMLHIIFLIALLIMVCCAAVTIVFFKYDAVKERSNRQTDGKLSNQEIITLVCGITFFSSFFVAMYAEVKSQVAFYKILARFWDLNREWKIEEYDKSFDAVPRMSFLSVPAKKSYEIDIATPIQRWIASTFSSADNPESSNAPQEFQKLRNNAVCKPLDRHESSLEILYRYYDQLVAVEAKLPFSATQIIIPFRWKDAFDKGSLFTKSALSLSSGGYEKASTLFNIAALQSQVAAAQTLESDTEVKLCAKLFQQSAGIFNYLKESVMGLIGQEATPDLMPDTLAALSTLMIAQGQEAIYLKAARDKMKPLVVSKIANQAAEFYAEAQKQMGRDLVRSLWDREWLAAVGGKQLGFQALAHYYQALVSKEASEIGPELAHLTKAKELISGASCAKLFPEDVNKVTRAYEAAKKDNDFIYHERIPDVKTLPAIGKAALSKALPITTPMGPGFRDLFSHLVPVVVQQALAAYDTRKAAIINGETARIREATQIMNGILASLNLPAAVEDACNADVLPASLKDKSNAMRSDGGLQKIKALIDDLPSLLQRNREILDETSRLITEEKASDDQLRSQFKEKWTRMASERLTEPLWAEIGKYKTILDTATGADQIVKQKFDAKRKGIELLSQPESDLRAAIPSLVGTGTGNTTAVVRLKQVLARVDAVKAERQTLEEELKDVGSKFNMSDVFLRALADSGALNEQDVSTDKLNEIYTPIRERISASIQVQEQLMREIQESNTSFVQERGTGGGEREKFLKELASAYDSYSELKANLQEGTKFYNDLTPLLVRLQQKVSDFCFARKTEKEELLKDLSQSIVGQVSPEAPPQPQHFQTAAKVPPGRPPPPRPVAPVQQHSAPPAHQQEFIPPPANAPVYHQAPPCQQQQQQGGYGGQVPPQPYANYGGMPQYPTYPGAYQQQPQQPYPTNPYPYGGPMPPQQNPYAPYQPYPQQPGNQPAYPNQPQPPYPQNPQWR